jgi:CRP/FNR family cyclic AMP-dependent transcriptional regulator
MVTLTSWRMMAGTPGIAQDLAIGRRKATYRTRSRPIDPEDGMTRSDAREIVAVLAAQPAFAEASQADLEDLANHANRTSIPKDWPLIHQNTPADACYVILSGSADVTVKATIVATITSGAVVGEAGLAGHKLRNASVTSTTALDLLHIEADQFTALIERRPALKAVLLARTEAAATATAQAND